MNVVFDDWFQRATKCSPFPYQRRVAEASRLPTLLEAPTGAGKTAAIVLGWLWHRRHEGAEKAARTSRRLVYCLPMRVLVDQVAGEARKWMDALHEDVGVHVLRGGHVDEAWEQFPDRDTIVVGTQDQLLSRALHRGYAMSRFRWTVPFGLLNNDAWWVLDEVQLMGPGLRTAAQLQGLREAFGAHGPVGTTFMSATLRRTWLDVPDFVLAPEDDATDHLRLAPEDWSQPSLSQRTTASKPLERAPVSEPKELAAWIAEAHEPHSLTLVVVNRVARAQELAKHLAKALPDADHVLIHSRFRRAERSAFEARLHAPLGDGGRVVVATQTIEAGVDLDAHRLITDLAPWPSLVQRFGRCNRRGDRPEGKVFWVDVDTKKAKACAPYSQESLTTARELLEGLSNVRIDALPKTTLEWPSTDLPRRRDVVGLFDTDPDLDGNFVDVSRWVRGEGSADVQVYWRTIDGRPRDDDAAPHPDELCPVSLDAFREFVKKMSPKRAWQWDVLEGQWRLVHANPSGQAPGFLAAGQTYLVDASAGGYDPHLGWLGKGDATPPCEALAVGALDAFSSDPRSESHAYVALDVHLRDAATQAHALCTALGTLDAELCTLVAEAAGWHDVGKAHAVFQAAARRPEDAPLLAKAPSFESYSRRGFRHELVSALLAVRAGRPDLVAFLVAAHHGKVRLSLRPLQWADVEASDELRGVRATDSVEPVDTPIGATPAAPPLPLDLASLGRGSSGASWTDRTLRLLERHGPFRLAYLEALVRISDWRASAAPSATWEVPGA
ncbi:MAG: CRISPR-associated helicase Cas3' [Myxococcales bacterium]|nr:CRISPR-associated helicase Cas3' [Myxococcales bacterium]